MHQPTFFRALVLTCLIVPFTVAAFAGLDKTTLKRGMANKKLTVKAVSLGGYCGRCISLQVTNNSQKSMDIDVDPGLIFVPADTTCQNLVAWGNEKIELEPGATKTVTLETFCGKSYAHSPYKDIKYNFWKQGDSGMVKMLEYAHAGHFNPHLVQRGVWAFTNGHSLSEIFYYGDHGQSEKLMRFVADIQHKRVPKYYRDFQMSERPGEAVVRRDSGRIVVPVKLASEGYKQMYVTIYKENGDIYKKIDNGRLIDKNGVTVLVEFKPSRDINGTYKVEARDETNRVWYEQAVEVDFDNNWY